MFWIVENKNQLDKLWEKNYTEIYLDVIPLSPTTHPVENELSLIYIQPIYKSRGYILCLNHSESLSLDFNDVVTYLKDRSKIYILDKKEVLHYIALPNLYDITFNLKNPPIRNIISTQNLFKKLHPNFKNLNKLIPLSKHYEAYHKDFVTNKALINNPINSFLNNKYTLVFTAIEKCGLQRHITSYIDDLPKVTITREHTYYNLKNATTRPTNSWNGINYMAIPKESGIRKEYVPSNDYLMEIDIKSYHPTLIAKLINYDFKGLNPHDYLASLYKTDYKQAKFITFKQIYGGIFDEYKELPFFKKTQEFIDELWFKFNNEGYIEVPISKHRLYHKDFSNFKPQKLFNYYLQGLETSLNVEIMWEILKLTQSTSTKLIHYTYDSMLFDVCENEEYIIKEISPIFKKHKLKVDIKIGDNYDFH